MFPPTSNAIERKTLFFSTFVDSCLRPSVSLWSRTLVDRTWQVRVKCSWERVVDRDNQRVVEQVMRVAHRDSPRASSAHDDIYKISNKNENVDVCETQKNFSDFWTPDKSTRDSPAVLVISQHIAFVLNASDTVMIFMTRCENFFDRVSIETSLLGVLGSIIPQ